MQPVSTLAHAKCLWPSLPGGTRNRCGCSPPLPEDLERLTARAVRGDDGGAGIHRSVLDSTIRDSRTTRHPPLFGECPPHEERTWTAHRLARMPMVTVPALGGITASCISAGAGRLRCANHTAAQERIGRSGQSTRAAHAQGADANEPANP